jgi:hypothetical protein
MNDNELITTVRESVADVYSVTPVEHVISRGRAVRTRRRIPGIAGTLALAAGTALALTTLLPSGHPGLVGSSRPGSHPASAQLAAWTVAKQGNGNIDVTINQLQDPAGLQSTLRADGLPVTVSFSGPSLSATCQPYDTSRDVLSAVAHFHASDGRAYLVINPSALPSGIGVSIFDKPGAGVPLPSPHMPRHGPGAGTPAPAGITGPLAIGLVYASQQCTGS